MHTVYFSEVLGPRSLNQLKISLIPFGECSELGSRKPSQWMKKEAVYASVDYEDDVGDHKYAGVEAEVYFMERHVLLLSFNALSILTRQESGES